MTTINKDESKNKISARVDIGTSDDESLQVSFRKFLDKRKQDIKNERNSKEATKSLIGKSRTDEEKLKLRSTFVELAKKYVGVPYSVRFKAPDEPLAPLYLDCCGLVRQVLVDMEKQIGFKVGRWNQCYQFDTLPIAIEEKDLKPGDVIFYEGTYIRPNARPQKHNIVHIEVYLGGKSGEASIGSRLSTGKVCLFDSYKFDSANWALIKYHYRSIDTWLNGICDSCCDEHPWLNFISTTSGRKSIFYDSDDEEADTHHDINEPKHAPICHIKNHQHNTNNDDDDDDEEHVDDDYVYTADDHSDTSAETLSGVHRDSNTPPPVSTIEHDIGTGIASLTMNSNTTATPTTSTHSKSQSNLPHTNPTNGATLSKSASSNINTNHNNSIPSSSTTTASTTITHDASPSKREKRVSAARNTITSTTSTSTTTTAVITTNTNTPLNIQGTASIVATKEPAIVRPPRIQKTDSNLCYYVNKANGWKLVYDALDKRGWTQLPFEVASKSTKYNLKWVQQRSQIDYRSHVPGQLVNHIANNDVICSKLGLLLTLRDKFCKTTNTSTSNGNIASPPTKRSQNTAAAATTTNNISSPKATSTGATGTITTTNATSPAPPSNITNITTTTTTSTATTMTSSSPIGYATPSRIPTPWLPETFEIDSASDVNQAMQLEAAELKRTDGKTGLIWLYKPSCNNRGRGIQVFCGE